MAKKKLTEEQENEIKTLLENNKMLEKTKQEAMDRGKTQSVKQIERAQQDVVDHINSIDPTILGSNTPKKTSLSANKKSVVSQQNLFQDTDMSIFDMLEENEKSRNEESDLALAETGTETTVAEYDMTPSETTIVDDSTFNTETNLASDVIQLPSNGECYRSKTTHVQSSHHLTCIRMVL